MVKIKFFQFYSKLNNSQKKDFKKFISSGYFNKGRDFVPFLAAAEKMFHKVNSAAEMVKKLSTELGYTNRSVWNRMHELKTLADRYIAVNEINGNELLFSNLVAKFHINNSEYGLFTQKVNYAKKNFQKTKKGLDTNYYYYQLLQQLGYSYIYQNKTEPFIKNLTEQVIYHSATILLIITFT